MNPGASARTRPGRTARRARTPARLHHKHWLGLILAGHLLLALVYSILIPPWEAHDEWAHYKHAAYIAENLALPNPGQRLTHEFQFDEASQPPLYYLLAAVPMLAVNTDDGYRPVVNPYAVSGTGSGGVNFVLHDREQEKWPWHGTLLALHLGRMVSVLIGTLGLLATYALVRQLSPRAPDIALIATAIQGFAPQYVFLGSVITNDILLIALETLFLYACMRLLREGPTARATFLLGLATVLALLTKYLALAILPLAGIALAVTVWLHRKESTPPRRVLYSALLLLAVLGLPTLLLLGRNYLLTGAVIPRDPVAQAALLGGLQRDHFLGLDWSAVPTALAYGFRTYWVSFGWGNIGTRDWVYGVWLGILLVGMVGVVGWLRRREHRRLLPQLTMAGLFALSVIALPLLRELIHDSSFLRGRYILPTLPLTSWIIAQGWAQIAGRAWAWGRSLLLLWTIGLTVLLLPFLLLPAYSPPTRAGEHAPQTHQVLYARFGDAAELVSADVGFVPLARPGEGLPVTLTWRVLARTDEPYTLAIHLVGMGGQSYGSIATYPGRGNAATTVWEPGTLFSETYWIVVEDAGPTPTRGSINVSLFREEEGRRRYLPVYDAQGNPVGDTLNFGALRIDRPADEAPVAEATQPILAEFNDTLLLTEVRLADLPQRAGWATPVLLRWLARNPGPPDLTVSVQLLDQSGQWVAGSDGPPSIELTPDLWRSGDRLHVIRWLRLPPDLPPGTYRVIVTLYRSSDMTRLPARTPDGHPLPDNAWPAGEIVIE
ncbi:MAG: phospholipid carrier-dependent glycosyltransferase [Caldilineae bacterium]|nr:MAG: phospholipid carrier-dependent glycosyltransferase [Caldilineae bacterium]